MKRFLLELGQNNPFTDMIHDLFKNFVTLMIAELLQWMFDKDPLLDKFFLKLALYSTIGFAVFYLVFDHFIGAGPTVPWIFGGSKKKNNDQEK